MSEEIEFADGFVDVVGSTSGTGMSSSGMSKVWSWGGDEGGVGRRRGRR